MTYVKTKASIESEPLPDAELFFIGAAMNGDHGVAFRKMFSISDEVYNEVWKPLDLGNVCQVSN